MLKILIAEDDRELRQLFSHVLIKNGYTVKGVSNGKEALSAMDMDYYDLIISDMMMPVMDGYEFVRLLREAGNNTPVLMITAKDAFDDMRQGFQSGTDDYMVKPVNVNEMVLRVGALLRRAQMINDWNHYSEKGYAPIYAKENFENCWKNYEGLGKNGVMGGVHHDFMMLPDKPKEE